MNLLIIIGNAVVDYHFRALLLEDPVATVEAYGFRLTKGEMAMLKALFTQNTKKLNDLLKASEDQVYANIEAQAATGPQLVSGVAAPLGCTKRPCTLSLTPPKAIEQKWEAAA